jgi:hypothetical protein
VKRLPLLFTTSLILASCGDTYLCPPEPLFPAFVNYPAQEIDTVFLEVYEKGTNFTVRVNTFRLDKGNSWFIPAGDTAKMFMARGEHWPTGDHDYRFINPADNKTVSITELQYSSREGRTSSLFGWGGTSCNSPLVSFKRDGVLITRANPTNGDHYVYITK